jgi:N,N'-diacetyllegionaminate synthase
MKIENKEHNFVKDGPFIIAEVGINHNGDVKLAKQTIVKAHECGASAVKLQTFRADTMCSKNSPYYDLFKKCELSEIEIKILNDLCDKLNILLFTTVFDEWAVDTWMKFNPKLIKIASGDITHIPLIEYVASKGIPIILSTGGSSMNDIEVALNSIYSQNKNQDVYILHCVSNYPTKPEDANLNCMQDIKKKFNLPVGFSDHTKGNIVSISAIASGASIIEKHFTLDQNFDGPDHKLSSNPEEFRELVRDIKIAYLARGNKSKKPVEDENFIKEIRRSISASVDIAKGSIIDNSMIVIRRPGHGIQPKDIQLLLGSKVTKDIKAEEVIKWEYIENNIIL